jgi:hypothetical protein
MFRKSFYTVSMLAIMATFSLSFKWNSPLPATETVNAAPAPLTISSAAPVQAASCPNPKVTVNDVTLVGGRGNPSTVKVTWTIANLQPCFKVQKSDVTLVLTPQNGQPITKNLTINGDGTTANVSLLGGGFTFDKLKLFFSKPTAAIATVKVTAIPVAPQLIANDQKAVEF